MRGESRASGGGLGAREQPVDCESGFAQTDFVRPLEQAPGRAARFRPFEVALVHPLALVVELPDAVVPPGNVETAHDEEVVVPSCELVERVGGSPRYTSWKSFVV